MLPKKIFIFLFVIFTFLSTDGVCENPQHKSTGFEFNTNRRSVRLPTRIVNKMVVVPMQINDSPPLNFILDTGVSTTILTEPFLAHLLEIPLADRVHIIGLGQDGIVEAARARGLTFSMHGITGENMDLIIIPEGVLNFSEVFGFPVHGILGYDFFSRFPVRINYRNETVRVFRQPNYRIRRNSEILPLEMEDSKPYVYLQLKGDKNHREDSVRLLLDIGATNPLFLNHDYTHLTEKTVPAYLGMGISGRQMGKFGRLQEVKLGRFAINSPLVAFPEKSFLTVAQHQWEWEGILGAGILSRFHIIIDYPSQQVVLRKNVTFNRPFYISPSGIEVVAKGRNYDIFEITHVREKSVAYEQDMQRGDTIISVNRITAPRLRMDDILEILNQEPGTLVYLEILRDNRILNKTLRLRKDL